MEERLRSSPRWFTGPIGRPLRFCCGVLDSICVARLTWPLQVQLINGSFVFATCKSSPPQKAKAEVREKAVMRSCGQAAKADSCININKATAKQHRKQKLKRQKQHQNTSNATKQQIHSKLPAQQHQQMQLRNNNIQATRETTRKQIQYNCNTATAQDRKKRQRPNHEI